MSVSEIITRENAIKALTDEVEEKNTAAKSDFYKQSPAFMMSHKLTTYRAVWDGEAQRAEIVSGERFAEVSRIAKKISKTAAEEVSNALKDLDETMRKHTAKEYGEDAAPNIKPIKEILSRIYAALNVTTIDQNGKPVKAIATSAQARFIRNGMTTNDKNAQTVIKSARAEVAKLLYLVSRGEALTVKEKTAKNTTATTAPTEDTKPTETPATEATPAAETVTPAETTPAPAAETPAETPKKSKKSA